MEEKMGIKRYVALLVGFTGCLTSPFYGQVFQDRSNPVPFQLWTLDKTKEVTVECAPASAHGGPYDGEGAYQLLHTFSPSQQPSYDPQGNEIYSAGVKLSLPNSCWRYYSYPDGTNYITVVRVRQGGSDSGLFTFDQAGLECLGGWIGKAGQWFGWLGKGCEKRYINTGGVIRTVFLKAKM